MYKPPFLLRRVGSKKRCFFVLFIITALSLWGQNTTVEEKISTTIYAETTIPVFGDEELFGIGYGGSGAFEYALLPFLVPLLHGGFHVVPVHELDSLTLLDAGAGVGVRVRPSERINLRADALGGVYVAQWRDYGTSGLFFGVRAEAGYRISPALTLSLHGGFFDYLSTPDPFLQSISAGVSINFQFSEFGRKNANIEVRTKHMDPIFPVFYSYYDENTFGTVEVINKEKATVRDVSVSVLVPEYMSGPRECGFSEELSPGEEMEIPLYTLLNDEVLELTENTTAQAVITVEYRIMGLKREADIPMKLTMYHRNAMTWDDDRKAAAFVSPTDPAVLWFSRFASGIAGNRMRGSINRNLQQAMAIFEALNVYGINYVIDPNSSYVELSEKTGTIDYLQFPHQTLFFRGGDCDDLSILYSALLESVGIRTAFITIPGHIYMAFALDMSEEEAKENFYDPSMLIFVDGEAWAPVEITLVKEGFLKAWRIGAKEWVDNAKTGNSKMYPIEECWNLFPPAGVPNVKARFSLPDEVKTIRSFDVSMDRYIAREIAPMKERLVSRSAESEKEKQNSLGILFGRYGMLNEAWEQFSAAAKSDYPPAWANLGNIAFLQQDYNLAIQYYNWALKLNTNDVIALLGLARSHYELENLEESDKAYTVLKDTDPELASQYGYLGSVLGGEGRAWTFADRLTSTEWAENKEKPDKEGEIYPDIRPVDEKSATASAEETGQPEPEPETAEPEPAEEPEEPPEPVQSEPEELPPEPEKDPAAVKPEPEPVLEPVFEPEPKITEEEPEAVEPAPAAETEKSPEIAAALPEDRELIEKREDAADRERASRELPDEERAPEPEPEPEPKITEEEPEAVEPAPAAETEEPPEIAAALPEDRELIEKREDAAARERASGEPAAEETEPEPEPELEPEPAPEVEIAEAEPEPLPEPEPSPQPEQDPEPEIEIAAAKREPEPAPKPAAKPEPVAEEKEPEPEKPEEVLVEEKEPEPEPEPEPVERDPEPEIAAAIEPFDRELPEEPMEQKPEPPEEFIEEEAEQPNARSEIVIDSFRDGFPAIGSWTLYEERGIQNDEKQLFAKLVVPAKQNSSKTKYSFSAKSTGSEWTGLGVHIYRDDVITHEGYGAGNSILIWVTYDPDHFGDTDTRLQVYRSYSDTYMELLKTRVITESIFDYNHYEIIFNRLSDSINVSINGKNILELTGFSDLNNGKYVIFRALDTAEFENFTVEGMQ